MGWLDPKLWLAILGSCAICLLGGFLYGRHEMKGVELAKCEADKAQASLVITDAMSSLQEESAKAESERIKREASENEWKRRFQNEVSKNGANAVPKEIAAACPLWPDSLVRKHNAAGQGNFLPSVGAPPVVPGPSVPATGRFGPGEVGRSR